MEFFSVKHGINAQFRRRTLAPQADKGDVAFRLNRQEMLDKIDDMIRSKRMKIDESNRREFLKRKDPEDSCSRVDAVQVNRSVQMKLDVVVNQDGPLARSTSSSAAPNSSNRDGTLNGVEARIRNAETHLGIASVKPIHIDVYKRLKRVEDRITLLEEIYPAWAATHFRQPSSVLVSNSTVSSTASSATPSANPFYSLQPDPPLQN
ncbi:hypothetical protein BJ742DRAFT_819102 [Cladochytrium replicatum]|nr:hypothetical protein BJ742DRAFT_819102 [Cladochytrium replicatum]